MQIQSQSPNIKKIAKKNIPKSIGFFWKKFSDQKKHKTIIPGFAKQLKSFEI